jgi:exopolysaccharide biosynthesis polyprenyl glycosylphosphotransferase
MPASGGPLPSVVRTRHRDRDFALRRALVAADLLGLWLALVLAMTIAADRPHPLPESLWILPTFPLWAVLFRAYHLYSRPMRSFEPTHLDDMTPLFHALLIGVLGLWVFYRVMPVQQLDLEEVVLFGLLGLPLIAALRAILRTLNLRRQGPERVFVVAPADDARVLQRKLGNHPEYEMALVGAVGDGSEQLGLSVAAGFGELEALIGSGKIDLLLVRLDADCLPQTDALGLMRACHRTGTRFGCFPGSRSLLLPGTEINYIEGMGILTSVHPVLSRSSALMKRSLDIVVSALLLVLTAPLMALIVVAIRLTSKGPALYRQVRVGKDGRLFKLNKFRTMVDGADRMAAELMEESSDSNWLFLADDPRVTRLGRVLRAASLDELPQLWNVLRGEMSLVGPRPLSEHDDKSVRGWHRHRLDLVPGITGYWQVLGRTNIPFEEMLEIDYAYVASWSLWHDVKLLLRTVPVVLRRPGVN